MLKVTLQESSTAFTLVLEGRLCRQWVPEAERAWTALLESKRELILDLSGVTFVDAAGELFLASVINHGATVRADNLLVGHLVSKLKEEREHIQTPRAGGASHRNPSHM
jgi:ABC-type transporter Mla MlaB component